MSEETFNTGYNGCKHNPCSHLFQGDIHGIPIGNCERCGVSWENVKNSYRVPDSTAVPTDLPPRNPFNNPAQDLTKSVPKYKGWILPEDKIKWEYHIASVGDDQSTLDVLGREGWELVAVIHKTYTYAYFKRRI